MIQCRDQGSEMPDNWDGETEREEEVRSVINWTKPVRTKGLKEPVRVLCTDAPGQQPVIGLVRGEDQPMTWTLGGSYCPEPEVSGLDLENVPETIRYSLAHTPLSLGTEPGSTVKWCVKRNGSIFAICYTHDDAETILHLMNGGQA